MRATMVVAVPVALLMALGCGGESPTVTGPGPGMLVGPVPTYGATIHVTNPTELYREVNAPANVGATLVLAPGTYTLDSLAENKGRLELQQDMSLQGQTGNAGAVIIDASELPASSYVRPDLQLTGAVRIGRGSNRLAWLTVRNAVNGVAAIETDLPSSVARLTISHVVAYGNRRGIDVRNQGASAAGRVLVATITDSEFRHNALQAGFGMRVVNADGATGGVISITLARNRLLHNRIGCFAGNNNTSYGTITLDSSDDQFDSNGIGCGVAAAVSGGVVASHHNVLSFTARRSTFRNNTGALPPAASPRAGLTIEGGASPTAGLTSFNTVSVSLYTPVFQNNLEMDIRTWAARSTGSQPAGMSNVASVVIAGAPGVREERWASVPGPAGTNVVSVIKY